MFKNLGLQILNSSNKFSVLTHNSDIFRGVKKGVTILGNDTILRNVTIWGSGGFHIKGIGSSTRIGLFVSSFRKIIFWFKKRF